VRTSNILPTQNRVYLFFGILDYIPEHVFMAWYFKHNVCTWIARFDEYPCAFYLFRITLLVSILIL